MAEAEFVFGSVFKGGTCTCLARLVGQNGVALVQADFAAGSSSSSSGECGPSATYTIYEMDDQDEDNRTAVSGHENVSLEIEDIIFDTLQVDDIWTVDSTGYNFRHRIGICDNPAFGAAGKRYLVEYSLIPFWQQLIIIPFRVDCK